MNQSRALTAFAVSAVVLALAGGWLFREPLGQTLGRAIVEGATQSVRTGTVLPGAEGDARRAGPGEEVASTSAPQTVYRWVDADGVTHYSQQGGAGREAVTLDPARIQRLEDLTPAAASGGDKR